MTTEVGDPDEMGLSADAVDDMARLGIVRQRVDLFFYGEFRYTRLEDAIAEAKRHPESSRIRT